MTREEELAAAWTGLRPRLVSVAYAVLGSRTEAEDVVADCWLSLVAADAREPVHDLYAWGTIAVARRAVDVLRSARLQREAYLQPRLDVSPDRSTRTRPSSSSRRVPSRMASPPMSLDQPKSSHCNKNRSDAVNRSSTGASLPSRDASFRRR
jgi:DNA-directed RNA polymerase specialized sigma24 family protein